MQGKILKNVSNHRSITFFKEIGCTFLDKNANHTRFIKKIKKKLKIIGSMEFFREKGGAFLRKNANHIKFIARY